MNGSKLDSDKLQTIILKNDFYAEEIRNSLNEFKLNFLELKNCYKDDNSNELYTKFETFSKNFEVIYQKTLAYNSILDKIIENYRNTNINVGKKISDTVTKI